MYERAAVFQVSFTIIAGLSSIIYGTHIIDAPFYRNLWIAAGSVFLGMIPYTLICIGPTNKLIIDDNKRVESGKKSEFDITRKQELLDKWASFHLVRTVGSVAGFIAMILGRNHHTPLALGW